jgi:hypothetical protein
MPSRSPPASVSHKRPIPRSDERHGTPDDLPTTARLHGRQQERPAPRHGMALVRLRFRGEHHAPERLILPAAI